MAKGPQAAGPPPTRKEIAAKRLQNVLGRHGIAQARTLEQKISDAGPNPQRVDPHILTPVRNDLLKSGVLVREGSTQDPWFRTAEMPAERWQARLAELQPIHDRTNAPNFKLRLGQTLEIAIYRALLTARQQNGLQFVGAFRDLDAHDDSQLYRKEEPASYSGVEVTGPPDFGIFPEGKLAMIEAKNIRPWIYPKAPLMLELLSRALTLNAVPVLIARRIHYSTFVVFRQCGVVMHEVYNQLYPTADAALAELVRGKMLLGYHDVRVGNMPDARLIKFITENMPRAVLDAYPRFQEHKPLLNAYVFGDMSYGEMVVRLRRGIIDPEESLDEPEGPDPSDFY